MNKLFDLTGRLALVTGSSRGIGRAIAEGYVAAGARVVDQWARRRGRGMRPSKAIGANAVAAPFDVTEQGERSKRRSRRSRRTSGRSTFW